MYDKPSENMVGWGGSNVAGIICPHLNKVNSLIDLPKYGGGAIVPLPLSPYSGISAHVPKECVEQKKSPVMILTLCTLGKGGLQPGTTVYWAKPSHYFTLLAAFWRLWQELNFAPPLFHFNAVRSHTGSFTCFSACSLCSIALPLPEHYNLPLDRCTDYGHTKAKSLILCGPNSNPNPLINIWDVGIKA